jgi:iron complex transport system permease protein
MISRPEKGARGRRPGKAAALAVALVLLLASALASLAMGSYDLSPSQVARIAFAKVFHIDDPSIQKLHEVIVWKIRAPRVILVLLAGAAFSVSGTAYQACFRNPLVEPYILGVSAGAAFGAALGIMFPAVFPSVQLSAFLCALLAVLVTYSLARSRGSAPTVTLVISGVVVGSLFTAFVSALKYVAPDAKLREITFWMLGGFYYSSWADVGLAAPVVLAVVAAVFALSWKLNILSMGDEEARALGVNPEIYKAVFILITTLAAALCVSMVGIVAWVGLMAPHAARMLLGADNSYVVPGSAILGAAFLLVCDTVARTLTGSEIPIGILTSIIGAPFLVSLLRGKGGAIYR